jgi:hypothetical protein
MRAGVADKTQFESLYIRKPRHSRLERLDGSLGI